LGRIFKADKRPNTTPARATVVAHDLRGGAALVLAALAAEGRSEILDISHIDRGYGSLEYKLKKLGADIKRITV